MRDAVHFFGAGPSLGRAQNDHGPYGLLFESVFARFTLNRANSRVTCIQCGREQLMDHLWIVAFDEIGFVPAPRIQRFQILVARSPCTVGPEIL